MYTGDETGFLRVYDLSEVITKTGVESVQSYEQLNPKFYPHRKEKCDVSSYAGLLYAEANQ